MTTTGDLLTHDEIVELTGKQKFKAQVRALIKMGVRHVVRTDGTPAVARAARDALLFGRKTEAPAPATRAPGVVNFDGLVPRKRRKTPT